MSTLAEQYVEILDSNVAELYAGTVTFEVFTSMNRTAWDTIQRAGPDTRAAVLKILRDRVRHIP